jgi:predicted dehydrogenase/threonine dehydrogenase-like Zn-dependent dehydrogenase
VINKLDSLTPLGYSISGVVEQVSEDNYEFKTGDRVACAGAGYANHAEINFVPKNLTVKIPENVSMEHAAFTTVGAIAMQGYRQAHMMVDESACVIGLGLLGQLLVKILNSAGINVVGVDLNDSKCRIAEESGAIFTCNPFEPNLSNHINRITKSKGIDVIFITAGGSSNQPVELAVKIARDRGKVVVIGKTKIDIDWKTYYEKELDIRFSRSYGPGRYDPHYEEKGIDYPIGYVRWTEKRNMESFLNLVSSGKINTENIVSFIYPFENASETFTKLSEGKLEGIGILFRYNFSPENIKLRNHIQKSSSATRADKNKLSIGCIGAGNYASSMLLPHLKNHPDVQLDLVCTTTSLTAQNAKRKFGFRRVTTDYLELLNDEHIDAVIVATRHNTHARIVIDAIKLNKPVFVEKPLAIKKEEVIHIIESLQMNNMDILQVGFNRRFSKAIQLVVGFWKNRHEIPFIANYRIHAGKMEQGSWYLDPSEGTRFIGEGGHFIDTLSFLFQSRPIKVYAKSINPQLRNSDDLDNISAVIEYENGSVGNIQYITQGGQKLPKEYLEIHGGGKSALMNNFSSISFYEGSSIKRKKFTNIDKGQKEEISAFIDSMVKGGPNPYSINELIDTTNATLAIHQSLITGQIIDLGNFLNP